MPDESCTLNNEGNFILNSFFALNILANLSSFYL